ncbi:hypothetical protein T484DRAFT_3058615 [Baffinella frigidus]|nr:hypothetical protein T484DRAFT_3058615 [Cryptophyta sp. CCMP2293]
MRTITLALFTVLLSDADAFSATLTTLPRAGGRSAQTRVTMAGEDASRRAFLAVPAALFLGATGAGADEGLIQYGSGSFSGKSLVNGVLSAYGLPQFADSKGFTPFLQQFKETIVEFSYPSSWVVNNKAKFADSGLKDGPTGITCSDYRTAEGVTLFKLALKGDVKSIKDVDPKVVADLVVGGGVQSGSGALGFKVKAQRDLPEEGYKELTFAWDSVTVSGYEVERVATCAATVKKGTLYAEW